MYRTGAPDFYVPPSSRDICGYELAREEAIEIITYYAERGRVHAAWSEVRKEIQIHFENRPRNTRQFPSAEAEWLKGLRELLTLRRSIPKLAERAARQLPLYEQQTRISYNQLFFGEAA